MEYLPLEIELLVLGNLDGPTTRMYGETCKRANSVVVAAGLRYSRLENLCLEATELGHFEIVKYGYKLGGFWDLLVVCNEAAIRGNLEIVKFSYENGCSMSRTTSLYASMEGHLNVLKYIHGNGCPWHPESCYYAAKYGHLDVVKFACDDGQRIDFATFYVAAENGRLEVVKYLHENDCPWDCSVLWVAASNGHLNVVKYFYENGMSGGRYTCYSAWTSRRGVEILAWLVDSGNCRCEGEHH